MCRDQRLPKVTDTQGLHLSPKTSGAVGPFRLQLMCGEHDVMINRLLEES